VWWSTFRPPQTAAHAALRGLLLLRRLYTTRIGNFYNGRHHSTVCYALKRIAALRQAHPDIDALLTNLADEIRSAPIRPSSFQKPTARKPRLGRFVGPFDDDFLDALADLIVERLCARTLQGGTGVALNENATISTRTLECRTPHFRCG